MFNTGKEMGFAGIVELLDKDFIILPSVSNRLRKCMTSLFVKYGGIILTWAYNDKKM